MGAIRSDLVLCIMWMRLISCDALSHASFEKHVAHLHVKKMEMYNGIIILDKWYNPFWIKMAIRHYNDLKTNKSFHLILIIIHKRYSKYKTDQGLNLGRKIALEGLVKYHPRLSVLRWPFMSMTVFSHQSNTMTRQIEKNCWICSFQWPL